MGKQQKMPNLDGYPTPERLSKSPNGMTLPDKPNDPGYINSPIRSEKAPNHAPIGLMERKLTPHELKKVTDFAAGYLLSEGKIRICDPASGGGMPRGKRPTKDYSPFSEQERFLIDRHELVICKMSYRVRCGLELIANMYVSRTQTTLPEFGAKLARDKNKKTGEGAITEICVNAAYEIEAAERYFEIQDRNNGIRKKSRFPKVELER